MDIVGCSFSDLSSGVNHERHDAYPSLPLLARKACSELAAVMARRTGVSMPAASGVRMGRRPAAVLVL